MKRIQSQCILQTLHFMLDPTVSHEDAVKKVGYELDEYKSKAQGNVKVLKETILDDGSVILEVKKKVANYSIGKYFDD